MKQIPINIEVEDDGECSNGCPFIEDNKCLLFNISLHVDVQNEDAIFYERHWRCNMFGN